MPRTSVTTRWDEEVLERTDAAVARAPRKTTRTQFIHEAVIDKLECEDYISSSEAEEMRRRV